MNPVWFCADIKKNNEAIWFWGIETAVCFLRFLHHQCSSSFLSPHKTNILFVRFILQEKKMKKKRKRERKESDSDSSSSSSSGECKSKKRRRDHTHDREDKKKKKHKKHRSHKHS